MVVPAAGKVCSFTGTPAFRWMEPTIDSPGRLAATSRGLSRPSGLEPRPLAHCRLSTHGLIDVPWIRRHLERETLALRLMGRGDGAPGCAVTRDRWRLVQFARC